MSDTTHTPAVLRLSRSEGGYQNTRLSPFGIDFSALCEALSKASVGLKDGAYFVRGPCLPTRADNNLPFAGVVVIDGDKRINPDTGEIHDTGAPHPSLAHEILRDLGIPHAIYTSHSHRPDRFRWRAIVPCHCPDQETLKAVVDWLIDQLHQAGCYVANAMENGNWSQPWYFPRIASAESEFLAFSHEDDDPLTTEQIGEIVAAWREAREGTAPPFAASGHRASEYDPSTPIGRFIAGHDNPEYIGNLLERHGYVFRHHAATNGRPAYRFTWPGSTSGIPGAHLFSGQGNGRWLVYSHHPEDPLHGRVRDVFGLFQLLEHGDNQSRAVAAAAEWARQEEREQDDQPGPKGRYRLLTPEELSGLPPIEWRVKGLLPAVALCALFGPSGSGKSFLVLDLVAAVARGLPDWHGHRVRPSPVIYCALEGETGIKHRIQAYMKANACELPDHLRFVLQPFDLTDQDDRQALLAAIHAEGLERPIIVLDTLSRATPGMDENSSRDMSLVIEGADEIKRSLQGLVLLVHHTGKDEGRGPRGHSSLKADFDGLITVTHDEARGRCWSASKVKLGEAHWFELEKVHLYDDADGDSVDSCVIRPVAAGGESKAWLGKPMPPSVRYGIDTLHSAIRESGDDGSVHVDDWRRLFYSGHTADNAAAKKVAFQRVRKELIDGAVVSVQDDMYTLLDGSGASWPDAHGYIQTQNLAAQWRRKCA